MNEDLKKNIILEHYENPVNKGLVNEEGYYKINMNSESCIDDLDFMIKIDNDIIVAACFDGEACAISSAASSIMMNLIIGKDVNKVLNIIDNYEAMIDERPYSKDILEEANVFDTIYKQANRKKCALLPFHGLKKILLSYKEK